MKKSILLLVILGIYSLVLAQVDMMGNGEGDMNVVKRGVISSERAVLVDSYPSPCQGNTGLTFDGSCLWIDDWATKMAYRVDTATMSVVAQIPVPGTYPDGLAWDGYYLWYSDADGQTIYKLNPKSGAVVDSFVSPGTFPTGLAFDGSNLWNSDPATAFSSGTPDQLHHVTTAGGVLSTSPAKGAFPTGMAYDGVNLWHSDNVEQMIYKLDPTTLTVLDSFSSPGQYPNDLAWDGRYLWVVDNGTDYLYKYDVGVPVVNSLVISPPSGSYVSAQAFDLVLIVKAPHCTVTGGFVVFNGNDITIPFASLAIPGNLGGGQGTTLRIPGIAVGDILDTGMNTLDATLTLSDGSTVHDVVEWEALENNE